MTKRLAVLVAVVAAAALALPSMSAASELTLGGKAVPVGEVVTGVSANTMAKTALGNLTCNNVGFESEVTANGAGVVKGKNVGEGVTIGCFLNAKAIEITDLTFKELELVNAANGKVTVVFTADLPGGVACGFNGVTKVTYVAKAKSIHVEGNLAGGACGAAAFSGDYALFVGVNAVVID